MNVTTLFQRPCLGLLALAMLAATTGASAVVAQQASGPPSAAHPASPLQYRRVFVPADRTADWPTGGAQYLPIERAEFERLVQQSEERRQLRRPGGAQLAAAHYSARLAEGDLLAGIAAFDLRLIDESPAVVSLAPWHAVVLRGRWLDDDAVAEPAPAKLGLWSGAEGDQVYGLLVEHAGKVELDWQATPARRGAELEFALQLPNAVSQRFAVELPPGATPTISSGRLIEHAVVSSGAAHRWTFQLAGGVEHRLLIRRPAESATAAPASASTPLVAVTEAYHLTFDGVDYEAELRIQNRRGALNELRINAPPALHIATVTVNRLPVEYRRDPEDAAAMLIPLPSSGDAAGAPVTVAVSGAASVTFDAPWKLPSVSAPTLFWIEGTSTLWVDPALEVRSLVPRECSLLNVVGIGSGVAGEVYRLQAWSPDASAELIVGDRRESLRHRTGVVAEFADREIAARARAVVWADGGRAFRIAAPLANDWNVESVVATPADGIVEWHVEEGDARQLHLQLRRSPAPSSPLTLEIVARKPWRAWTRMASLGDLEFMQLPGESEGQWLLAKDRRGNEVIPDARLAQAVVTTEARPLAAEELLGDVASGLLINLQQATPNALVSVASTAITFSGEAWMDLSADGAGYEHRAEILCRPASGALSELRLLAARPLPADALWKLDDGQLLSVEPASAPLPTAAAPAEPQPASSPPSASGVRGPVEYRLRLPQPRSAPFRLSATWRGASPVDAVVNLLSLPDAQAWQAWAIFRGHADKVAVDPRGAAPAIALPNAAAPGDQLPVIACYRLGDDPAATPAAAPTFVALPEANDAVGVVAWSCAVVTQQFADGTQKQRIDYRIESRQSTDVQFKLPDGGGSFTSAALDGRPLATPSTPDAGSIQFRIPGALQLQTLTLQLERKIAPLGRDASIELALPHASFPLLRGEWTLHWPTAFNATVSSGDEPSGDESADWLARLCGPLAGRGGQRWYDGMLLAHIDAASPIMPASSEGVASPGGWSSLSQSFVNRPAPIALSLASGEQANWHVAWLVAAVGGGWLWARSRRAMALLTAAVAASCLIVPEPFIPLPQATFLGLLTGAIVRQLVSFLTKSHRRANSRSRLSASNVLVALAVAALFASPLPVSAQAPVAAPILAAPAASAAPSGTAVLAPENLPPQVLFPVDDAGQPVGADVYVPAQMAADLLPSAVDASPVALIDARCQIELQPTGAEVVARRVQLRFRWESRRPQTLVEVPTSGADGAIDPTSLLLDGQPVVPARNAAGTSLSLNLAQPGTHELTALVALPAAESPMGSEQRARLQIPIPPLSGAVVEILHPTGLHDVRVASAAPVASHSNAARSTFRVGSTQTLDVSWPARLERESAGVAVEQLSVLDVDPAGALLEVRLRLSGEATTDVLRLATSPQLKLLPLPEGSPLEVASSGATAFDAPGAVTLRFRSTPTLPLTLSLQFQLQRALSVGRIGYPWVEVVGMDVRSRHFAVKADSRLRIRDSAAVGLTSVPPAELEALWGPAVASASLHYAVAAATPDWLLNISPAPARFTSREALELHCGDKDVRIAYSAAISDVEGELLVHRLVVSPDLRIEQVAATLDGSADALPLRWARPEPDEVHVFLSRPLSEPHLLRIEGRLNDVITAEPARGAAVDAGLVSAVERTVQLPRIALESAQAAPIDLLLFRTSDVLVDWASPPPPPKPLAGSLDRGKGLFVGQFTLPRGAAPLPELKVALNDAQYEADALLTLQLESAEATAQCRLQGLATRGIVDRLQLIVGKNWRGPFACDPAASVVRCPLAADPDRQMLDVTLARPIPAGESFNLLIRGAVSLEDDQRIRFPTLRLANAGRQRTFLVLPPTAGNLTAEWTLRGLQSQPLPDSLAAALNLPQPPPAYRVERERFVAEQRVFPDAMRSAAYRLAETRVAVDHDGSAIALAQLIVQAGGGDECHVGFPAGAELQYVAVDGVPQQRLPAQGVAWQAPAASKFLPRVFLFSYRLPPAEHPGGRRFEPPQVTIDGKSLAPQISLWQIADADGQPQPFAGGKSLTAVEFAVAARRRQIDAFLDAYPLASQLAEWELQLWRQPWLDRLSGGNPAAGDPAAWTRLRDRLLTGAAGDRVAPIDPVSHWSTSPHNGAAFFQGDADGAITLAPRTAPWPIGRWLAATALAAIVGVSWRQPAALRRLTLPMKRWPYVALGVAGLLWWYCLSPSLLGLLIIAFAIAAYWKSRR